jgi:hypothetical protein
MPENTETSGSFQVSPAAPSSAEGFTVSPKMLMQVAAFALAGAVGGGGVSFAAGPKDELTALKTIVETVALSVNEISVDMRYARKERKDFKEQLDELKKRVRVIEMGE